MSVVLLCEVSAEKGTVTLLSCMLSWGGGIANHGLSTMLFQSLDSLSKYSLGKQDGHLKKMPVVLSVLQHALGVRWRFCLSSNR